MISNSNKNIFKHQQNSCTKFKKEDNSNLGPKSQLESELYYGQSMHFKISRRVDNLKRISYGRVMVLGHCNSPGYHLSLF